MKIDLPLPEFQFLSQKDDEEVFHQSDLVELKPYGLSVNTDQSRPFLLLKDVTQEITLPVAINPLEAGITLTQSAKNQLPLSAHKFSLLLLQSLDIQALQCVFVQVKGVHQFVRIYISGHPKTNSIKLRADEAMSLCLYLGIPIFATRDFISRSKVMAAEIQGLTQGLSQNPKLLHRQHEFLM